MENNIIQDSLEVPEVTSIAIDPVKAVNDFLTQNGHTAPTDWMEYLVHQADAVDQAIPVTQRRFLVNRALRTILGQVTDATASAKARYCLIDNGDEKVWLQLITESVLPLIIQHNLPKPW